MAHYQFTLPSGQPTSFDIPSPLTPADRTTIEHLYGLILHSIPDAPESEPAPTPRQSPAEQAIEQERDFIHDDPGFQAWAARRRR